MYNMYWKYILDSTPSCFLGFFLFFVFLKICGFFVSRGFILNFAAFVDFVGGLVCRYGEKGGKEKHRSFCHMLFYVHA
jgi:hypothetical protein